MEVRIAAAVQGHLKYFAVFAARRESSGANLRYLEGWAGTHLLQAVREGGQAGLHKRGCSADGSQVRTGRV